MDNVIQIGAQVNLAGLQDGMQQAANTVRASTQQMADSFTRVAKAELDLSVANQVVKQTMDALKDGTLPILDSTMRDLGEAKMQAAVAARTLAAAEKEVAVQSETTTRSITEARYAAQLLGQEIGTRMPRAMSTVIANSQIIGPALNAAFDGIVIIGFIQLIISAGQKIAAFVSSLHELSKEEQDAIKQYAEEVKKAEQHTREILTLERERALVGKDAVTAAQMKAQWAAEDALSNDKSLDRLQKQYEAAKKVIDLYNSGATKPNSIGYDVDPASGMPVTPEPLISNEQLEQAQTTVTKLEAIYGEGLKDLENQTDISNEQQLLKAAQAGQAQADQAKKNLEKIAVVMAQARDARNKAVDQSDDRVTRMMDTRLEIQLKQEQDANQQVIDDYNQRAKAIHDSVEAQMAAVDEEIAHEKAAGEQRRQQIQELYQLGIISTAQRLALIKQSLDTELKLTTDAVNDKLQAMQNDPTLSPRAYEKARGEIAKLRDKYNADEQKADHAFLQTKQKVFQQYFTDITNGLKSTITGMLQGSQSLVQGLANIWNQIVSDFIGMLLQMGEKWVEKHVMMLVFHQQTKAAEVATDTAAQAAKAATNAASIASDAAVAGAGAYAATAMIPFVGPELAPAAAASAYAGAMGFESLAFFEGGGNVAYDMPAFLHKDEMVLPAGLARSVRSMTAGGGGGGNTFNYAPTVNTNDPATMRKELDSHYREFKKRLKKDARGLGFSMA